MLPASRCKVKSAYSPGFTYASCYILNSTYIYLERKINCFMR